MLLRLKVLRFSTASITQLYHFGHSSVRHREGSTFVSRTHRGYVWAVSVTRKKPWGGGHIRGGPVAMKPPFVTQKEAQISCTMNTLPRSS